MARLVKKYEYPMVLNIVLHRKNIDQIRDYSIAFFMYKLSNGILPSMFENMFIQTSDVHNYSTRQADLLYDQYAATKRTQRTIKHYGTNLIAKLLLLQL